MDMLLPPGAVDTLAPESAPPGFPRFSYAYQPIVDVLARAVYSQEALIRGPTGESAYQVLKSVPPDQKFSFDLHSRCTAIALAARLSYGGRLNLNFLPQGLVESSNAILATLEAARANNVANERIVLEVTEEEVIDEPSDFATLLNEYRGTGILVAIDDFGAGYSGLNLLAEFQPDLVKIDMKLIRGIEQHGPRQAIVRAVAQACDDLGIEVIAEGVETVEEYSWFMELGIRLFQGHLFAKPEFESFPEGQYPDPV
jgi:EAL domain-containing protein (putative c-di-GMP-specific phosphodiesterase class I)